MEWLTYVPWGALATIAIAVIAWLGRLHYVSGRNHDRLALVEDGLAKAHGEVQLTNARITITEKDLIEVRSRAVTRDDLKEIKVELAEQINAVAVRMEKAVGDVRADLRATGNRSRTTRSE